MYKAHTIEQFHILQYMKQHFNMQDFILSPISKNTLLLEDSGGAKISFDYCDGAVKQTSVPVSISANEVRAYIGRIKHTTKRPVIRTFEDATHWWLNHPNPLSYQQLLGLPDDLYRHYLTRELLDDEDAMELASRKLVTELEYDDLMLWYRNRHIHDCWIGPYGVDGTGNSYQLIMNYRKPAEYRFLFYVKDEYYCFMNGLPYPYEINIL